MDILQGMVTGFAVCLEPTKLLACFFGVLVGTAMGVLPGIGPAGAVALLIPLTFHMDAGIRRHHDRGDLLRHPVRGIHHIHSRQYPGGSSLRHHLPGWIPDDTPGSGGGGARDLRLRLVHRRDHRGHRPDAPGAAAGGVCPEIRPSRDLCPRLSGLHPCRLSLQRVDDPLPHDGCSRSPVGHRRTGGDYRDPALHLRQCGSAIGTGPGPADHGAFRDQRGSSVPGKHETRGGGRDGAAHTQILGFIAQPSGLEDDPPARSAEGP